MNVPSERRDSVLMFRLGNGRAGLRRSEERGDAETD